MKILIISENPHNTIGGIEKYNKNLIDLFIRNNWEVHEFSFNFNPEKREIFKYNKKVKILNPKVNTKKLTTCERLRNIKIFKNYINRIWNDYDVVINSTANIGWNKNIYNSSKWIYVQHFNKDFYKQKYIAGKLLAPLIYFGMWIFGIKNPFKKFKNLVFFSEQDKLKIIGHMNKQSYTVPICSFSKKQIHEFISKKQDNNSNFVFFGRIDNKQKNIKFIIKTFLKIKNNIDFYGDGEKKIMVNNKFCMFKGKFNHDKMFDTLNKYNFSILLSKYEGFPYSVVESLSMGLVPISTNNCESINWLLDGRGYIVNKKNVNKILKECSILSKEDINNKRKECFKFSLEHLTLEIFNDKWVEIIKKTSRHN